MKIITKTVSVVLLLLLTTFPLFVQADKAPDFILLDQNGSSITLKEYRGKGLILHFWGTWCPFCRQLQPGLERLYRKYKNSGLEVLAVSIRESDKAQPAQVLADLGISFRTALNGDKVAKIYQVPGTPTTFFIDRRGQVVWKTHIANPNDPLLEKMTRKILALDQ